MEEERKKKDAEERKRQDVERRRKQLQDMEGKESSLERDRQLHNKKKEEEEAKRKKDRAEAERILKQKEQEQHSKGEVNRIAKMGGKQVMVSGASKGGAGPAAVKRTQPAATKTKAEAVEEERIRAEAMLEKKLKEKKQVSGGAGPSFSHAGYIDLRGELKHVLITKVVRKLGIAIDGGANTKQKAVIIREISVSHACIHVLSYRLSFTLALMVLHTIA